MSKQKINVLLVFANPYNTDPLRLGTEERAIKEAIKLSPNRDNINIVTCSATTIHDLRRALLANTFDVIQISAHGSGEGLALETEAGGLCIVPQHALAKLVQSHESIKCIILNACYSFSQGNLISQTVPFTIAVEGSLDDRAAIEFSRGFYDALGAKCSIEASYEQGCLAIELTSQKAPRLPLLLKQGEATVARGDSRNDVDSWDMHDGMHFRNVKAIVGIVIDFSGSMARSIRNETNEHLSRLESVQQALTELAESARKGIQQSRVEQKENSIDVFVYGFGLRMKNARVCDLFSLIKASRQIITNDIVEQYKQRYMDGKRDIYRGYRGVGGFFRQLGLSNAVDIFDDIATHHGQTVVRKRIWQEMMDEVEACVKQMGDTTLPIEEVADWWKDSSNIAGNAEAVIFGDTPIVEALQETLARFERELQQRSKGTRLILFLVSDGKFPHTDSLSIAKKLQAMGVTIFSCFVTDKDSANPRELLHDPRPDWEREARLMFEMASPLDDGTEIERFLLRKGWSIHRKPKLFVQVNHSDVLKEFVRVTLGQLEDKQAVYTLPRGW